jgi:ferrochelatase
VVARLAIPSLDWSLCYQSRVGPLEWIGPSTDAEVRRAGADRVPLVVCPIAFVSEHSETLVEIEVEYRHMAAQSGVPAFFRVPAVGVAPAFIEALADLVRGALQRPVGVSPSGTVPLCPIERSCAVARATP